MSEEATRADAGGAVTPGGSSPPTRSGLIGPFVRGLGKTLGTDFKRTSSSDLTRIRASADERAAQAAATPAVVDARAQDHFAWRASTLRLAVWLLAISFVIGIIDWISNLAETKPEENLRLWVLYIPMLAKVLAAGYLVYEIVAALAHGGARPGRASKQIARGWLVALGGPLLFLLIPWGSLILDPPDGIDRASPQVMLTAELVRMMVLVMLLMEALPALLSVFPGLFRAGLTMKTGLPTRSLGPVAAAAAGPLNALYLVVLLVVAQGILESWALPVVAALLLGAPLLTGLHCAAMSRPMTAGAASTAVRRIRVASRWLVVLGAVGLLLVMNRTTLFGYTLFGLEDDPNGATKTMLGIEDLLRVGIHLFGMMLVFTVVASDLLHRLSPVGTGTERSEEDAATLSAIRDALAGEPVAGPTDGAA